MQARVRKRKRKEFILAIFASFWSDAIVVAAVVPSPSKETRTIITSSTEKMSVVSRTAHLVHVCNALHGRVTITDTFSTADDDVFFFTFSDLFSFTFMKKKKVVEKKETVQAEKSETH